MSIQTINLGTAPTGAGGDTFRSTGAKVNENFSNPSHAASRYVGTGLGNVMEVGAFGLGSRAVYFENSSKNDPTGRFFTIATVDSGDPSNIPSYQMGINIPWADDSGLSQILFGLNQSNQVGFRTWDATNGWAPHGYRSFYHTGNVIKDGNGFLKGASPVIRLFANTVELNNEARQQNIEFEKLSVGDYLIKGSSGFAQDGWYIETPKDANGNLLVAVVYEQLENGDISVKTYDYMLNKKGRIVADIEAPLDIPENRWIDIRLQELPQPEFVPPVSNTPAIFQPTGIAQAVSEMMNGTEQ